VRFVLTLHRSRPGPHGLDITRTGKKYHRDGYRYLSASKIAISLKDAKAKGYTACKVCHPQEWERRGMGLATPGCGRARIR